MHWYAYFAIGAACASVAYVLVSPWLLRHKRAEMAHAAKGLGRSGPMSIRDACQKVIIAGETANEPVKALGISPDAYDTLRLELGLARRTGPTERGDVGLLMGIPLMVVDAFVGGAADVH